MMNHRPANSIFWNSAFYGRSELSEYPARLPERVSPPPVFTTVTMPPHSSSGKQQRCSRPVPSLFPADRRNFDFWSTGVDFEKDKFLPSISVEIIWQQDIRYGQCRLMGKRKARLNNRAFSRVLNCVTLTLFYGDYLIFSGFWHHALHTHSSSRYTGS